MKSLVVSVSVSHGNTEKVARAISEVLGADLKEAKDVDPTTIPNYDLIGLGSGIFYSKFHAQLRKLVRNFLPVARRCSYSRPVALERQIFTPRSRRKWKSKDIGRWVILPVKVGTPGPRSNWLAG